MRALRRRDWLAHCSVLLCAAPQWAWAQPASAAQAAPRRLLVLGDSLSAEYGLARGSGWVTLLEARIAAEKLPYSVFNASISGETTSGGRSRLPALLQQHKPAVVVIELGANDALRGLPLAMTQANLAAMVQAAKAAGARVLIAGMMMPPNYGRQYAADFAALFASVAKSEGSALLPFFLQGVADVPQAEANFQADGLHPKASAHARLLDNVWPVLRPLLR